MVTTAAFTYLSVTGKRPFDLTKQVLETSNAVTSRFMVNLSICAVNFIGNLERSVQFYTN